MIFGFLGEKATIERAFKTDRRNQNNVKLMLHRLVGMSFFAWNYKKVGQLIIIGGAEDKEGDCKILREFVRCAGDKASKTSC
jgi:cyanophycinase-like exopeptidase